MAHAESESKRARHVTVSEAPTPVDLRESCAAARVGRDPTQKIRPILGGIRIVGKITGTLGLVVESTANEFGFLTAGHVCGDVNSLVGQPTDAEAVAMVMVNGYLKQPEIDVAFARVLVGVKYTIDGIYGNILDYYVNQYMSWPIEDQEIQIQGANSGSQEGKVLYPNVDITWQGKTLKEVSIATYASQPGDSGAPVVVLDDDKVTLVGIHGGRVLVNGHDRAWFTPVATIEKIIPFG